MENALKFLLLEKEVQLKLFKIYCSDISNIIVNTVYTIIDGIFVSTYVRPNAHTASISIVYPIAKCIVDRYAHVLPPAGAVSFCTLEKQKKRPDRSFSVSSFAAYFAWMPRFPDDSYESLNPILTILGLQPRDKLQGVKRRTLVAFSSSVVISKELFIFYPRGQLPHIAL